MKERMELALGRLKEIVSEKPELPGDWRDFFVAQCRFLLLLDEAGREQAWDAAKNRRLYEDILPENYEKSWCDPAKACAAFGREYGQLAAAVAAEMRAAIPAAVEGSTESLLIRMELLLQLYHMTERSFAEEQSAPPAEQIREVFASYVSDYYETECGLRIRQLVDASQDFALRIIRGADLSDPSYLYRFGEYITENEIELARYINALPEEKVRLMADTWTEAYRMGFITTGKDLSKKKSVNIEYPLGFERVVRLAVGNFEKMGLRNVIFRAAASVFHGYSVRKRGYYGADPNPQYTEDHREDSALILDGQLVTRHLECVTQAYEAVKELAAGHAGPAVMESFGEKPFVPVEKPEACRYSEEQRALDTRFRTENSVITNRYVPGEERSFTIIAFPVPAIGKDFPGIFDATIRINTLDYRTYQRIQASIIDALNDCVKVHVQGMKGNRTELSVSLYPLTDPSKQAIFENCVADVNVPVGEVFTTPVLKGTNGRLHVSRVFLNQLEFKDLCIELTDGLVSGYDCANYASPEQNRKYIEDHLLFHHKTLPMGEMAIGTNTVAYVTAERFGIGALLPILIAEKTGPHFAFGDSCYSHAEDVAVFNPDGKEIVARDNEISLCRKTDISKAYFGCHTDVTLPYDELGLLEGVRADGSSVCIIRSGRFVLPGTEELNKAFEEAAIN
ncbi:MAG: aminopeptidase [Lachnospiraceae bacterium]|nr:aminopeptidase [Lachnospiraceae bacterium]